MLYPESGMEDGSDTQDFHYLSRPRWSPSEAASPSGFAFAVE